MRLPAGPGPNSRVLLLGILIGAALGCAGPRRGIIGELRGRSRVLEDIEDAAFEAGASTRPSSGEPAGGAAGFPVLFHDRTRDRWSLEVLWPILEAGRAELPEGTPGDEAGGEPRRSVSRYFRLRPFLFADSFRSSSRTVVFPFYFRIRESLESGDRAIDHLWPFYGRHREWIDLAPATTHHVLYPIACFRQGPDRFLLRVLPLISFSKGYRDRGTWLLPIIKVGWHGPSRFFQVLDPLFTYERLSIAPSREQDRPELGRTRWMLLGGLLGWENERGKARLRVLWFFRL